MGAVKLVLCSHVIGLRGHHLAPQALRNMALLPQLSGFLYRKHHRFVEDINVTHFWFYHYTIMCSFVWMLL